MEKKTKLSKTNRILRINGKRPPKTLSKTPKETQSHIYIEKYILILKKPIKRKREQRNIPLDCGSTIEELTTSIGNDLLLGLSLRPPLFFSLSLSLSL